MAYVFSGDAREVRAETVLLRREEAIPFDWPGETLGVASGEISENRIAVVVRRGRKYVGVGVDEVISQTENIVKPIDPLMRHCKGISGGMQIELLPFMKPIASATEYLGGIEISMWT